MSKRKIRIVITILVIVISLFLLIWGIWPFLHITKNLIFPAGSLQVP